jgi:hypothetical protein
MPSRSAGLALAVAVLLVIAGCGGQHTPTPAGSALASASPSAAPSEPAYSTTPVIAKPVIGSLRGVSRASAEAAFTTLIGYVRADSYAPRRMQPKSEYSAADFAGPTEHMTPQLAKWWRKQVAAKYQTESAGSVGVIALFNVQGTDDNAFAAKGPLVVNERISKPTISGIGGGALKIGLTYNADLRMIDTVDVGRPILIPVTKTVTYTLVRARGAWLIDNFEGAVNLGRSSKPGE